MKFKKAFRRWSLAKQTVTAGEALVKKYYAVVLTTALIERKKRNKKKQPKITVGNYHNRVGLLVEPQLVVWDIDAVRALLKKQKIREDPESPVIVITESINAKAIETLLKSGKLKLKEVRKCFSLKDSTPYVRLVNEAQVEDDN